MSWTSMDIKILNKIYTEVRPIIALERADNEKDWNSFNYILNKNYDNMMFHIYMTKSIFDYNIFELSEEDQKIVLKRNN